MYRASMYSIHDKSMMAFAELFNNSLVCRHIEMRPNPEETFDNDGIFIDTRTQTIIGYDWEYRDRYFANGIFQYSTLGQYERKLEKDSIQLSLQCDSTQTAVAVGWHEDWLREKRQKRSLLTDSPQKQQGFTRYTTHFKIYSYEQIDQLKQMIADAMRLHQYSSEIFGSRGTQ